MSLIKVYIGNYVELYIYYMETWCLKKTADEWFVNFLYSNNIKLINN